MHVGSNKIKDLWPSAYTLYRLYCFLQKISSVKAERKRSLERTFRCLDEDLTFVSILYFVDMRLIHRDLVKIFIGVAFSSVLRG